MYMHIATVYTIYKDIIIGMLFNPNIIYLNVLTQKLVFIALELKESFVLLLNRFK